MKKSSLSLDQIHYMFAGVGNDNLDEYQQGRLYIALQHLPREVLDFAVDNLWFVSSNIHTWAFCQRIEDIKNIKALIFFSEGLWKRNQKMITECVAHEIAHAYLNHAWNLTSGEKPLKKEIEADKLASKWLGWKVSDYSKKKYQVLDEVVP